MPRKPPASEQPNSLITQYETLYKEQLINAKILFPESDISIQTVFASNLFVNEIIKKFEGNSATYADLLYEINLIERALPYDMQSIFMRLLNNEDSFDSQISFDLFKICLDKFKTHSTPNEESYIHSLKVCKDLIVNNKDSDLLEAAKNRMIHFLDNVGEVRDKDGYISTEFKIETFNLLKLPGIDDKVKDAIIRSLRLNSEALILVVKGDNKDLISKIYESPKSFNDQDKLKNGALHYACLLGNVDAIMILQGIAEIIPAKNSSNQMPLSLFPQDRSAEKKKLVTFGIGLKNMEPSQKFIYTFKNLSDDGKKQLISKFLEHKKFPNSASELGEQPLKDFFATFCNDAEAFQKLADLMIDKRENQTFIALITGSKLFDKKFKDDLKLKSKTPAEKLIDRFNSLKNDDDIKALLTNILQNRTHEITNPESKTLEDDDVYNFFKIFLREEENQKLFHKFIREDEEFLKSGAEKIELISEITSEFELDDFITFLKIFSSSDFQETSETIKVQVEHYVSEFKKEFNLAFKRAFDMPENHLALSNLYLNYPEETKEIFTLEKLETLLRSDLEISQKQKLLPIVLDSENFNSQQKIALLTNLLEGNDEEKSSLIYDYFLTKDLPSVKELLTQEVVEKLFKSSLNQEKRLNLAKKILGYDGLDGEFKKSFYGYLPEEIISFLNQDSKYVAYIESLVSSATTMITQPAQNNGFSATRVVEKRGPSSPDSPPSVRTASDDSLFSAIRVNKVSNGTSPDEPAVSHSPSPDELAVSHSPSPDELAVSHSPSPVDKPNPDSPSIISSTIAVGSPGTKGPSAIAVVDNVLSVDDCKELNILLTGSILKGFYVVQTYTSPETTTCILELRKFCRDYEVTNGNDGIKKAPASLKTKFHDEFQGLVEKILRSDPLFDKSRLISYLYSILAITSKEDDAIPSFLRDYEYLIENRAKVRFDGVGHGSWIDSASCYVKLKNIIKDMEKIHDDAAAKGKQVFTEFNLSNWMKAQINNKKFQEAKYSENKEFVKNLIEAFQNKSSDAKSLELIRVENSFKSLLEKNADFLKDVASIKDQEDSEHKDLATHLFDNLIKLDDKDMTDTYKIDELETLKQNFSTRIEAFKSKISSEKPFDFDSDDQLILDLILKIPTNIDDIFKEKLTKSTNSFEEYSKIELFKESLNNRVSIARFREICESQAEKYSRQIAGVEHSYSPAKSSRGLQS